MTPPAPASPARRLGRTILGAAAVLLSLVLVSLAVVDASSSASGASARNQLTLIAPAAAGGGWDSAAREAQQTLRTHGVVNNSQVVNVPGAGGTIGLSELSGLEGDSSTMMLMGITMLGAIKINGSGVDLDDVTPIARLTDDYDVLVVPADSPYDSADELVAAWREDPAHFAFGGGSLGSVDQMIISQLASRSEIDPGQVNYIAHSGGGELATALLSGTISASVSGYADFEDQIEAGRLKALAVSAPEPVEAIPYPTLNELGYDVELTNWRGIVAPPGLTADEREELEAIVDEMVRSPEWSDVLARNEWTDTYLSGEDFEENLRAESETVDRIWSELGY
ncbi:tripartite tricarboxylate transporter substrate-binding protein [Rothia sp. AR01]|uniref:Tripartite tricarboxylate transporter substrate-binding protein n=1 Tax=Rothia santali TaxID=2949643 RepID=A0A9X2HF05_9MICC|nr:tripartite tricarboxylate transporter substrate-binding protein [Rothia santali]MCP3425582.1 tripartite tricarboxylate transporter substrate-binding protein [Rothia santali]